MYYYSQWTVINIYHYIYSYYVEHHVSLASAGPSQTPIGQIAMTHYLHLTFFTMLLVPCMSVKVLSTDRSNTMHMYRFKITDTRTVKLHSDIFPWQPPQSPGKTTHRPNDTDIWMCVLSCTHRFISRPLLLFMSLQKANL